MRARLTWGLFGLCLTLTVVGLAVLRAPMAPVHPCSPAQFWWAACGVDISDGAESVDCNSFYPPRDGYAICYEQWIHSQYLCRVRESAAYAELPKVVARLEQLPEQVRRTAFVVQGYRDWLDADASRSDARLLLRKVKEAERLYFRQNSLSIHRTVMEEERLFDRRWPRVRRYWLNVLFEFVYLTGLIVFAFWPWLRRQTPWRRCAHLALLPALLVLPCHLGYANWTFTSAGPSGGVLYPWLVVWLEPLAFLPFQCLWLLRVFPKPLGHISQPLGPWMAMSGGGAPGLVACLLAGAAAGLVLFLLPSLAGHVWRARHAPARAGTGPATGEGREATVPPFWAWCRWGALWVPLAVASALVLAGMPDPVLCLLAGAAGGPVLFSLLSVAGHVRRARHALARAGAGAAADGGTEGRAPTFWVRYLPGVLRISLVVAGALVLVLAAALVGMLTRTSFIWAAEYGHLWSMRGALMVRPGLVRAHEPGGYSALHIAVLRHRTEMTAVLLAEGADPNARTADGQTSLHLTSDPELTEMLLSAGADVHATDDYGETPLHHARTAQAATVLLEHGARIDALSLDGRAPLHHAGPAVVEALLANGADLEARDAWGQTPLHLAAVEDSDGTARTLLGQGADINAARTDGRTALHIAVDRSDASMVQVLLEGGADVNAVTADGRTPLDLLGDAARDQDIRDLLLEHGAGSGP
jgi:ankyrin repeat protein